MWRERGGSTKGKAALSVYITWDPQTGKITVVRPRRPALQRVLHGLLRFLG